MQTIFKTHSTAEDASPDQTCLTVAQAASPVMYLQQSSAIPWDRKTSCDSSGTFQTLQGW